MIRKITRNAIFDTAMNAITKFTIITATLCVTFNRRISDRPSASFRNEVIDQVRMLVMDDFYITIPEILEDLGVQSKG